MWPARYIAAAAGSHLQLNAVSVKPGTKGDNATLVHVSVQNNGLGAFEQALSACVRSTSTAVRVRDVAGWALNKLGTWCGEVAPMASRAETSLPPMTLEWQPTAEWLELSYAFETHTPSYTPSRNDQEVDRFHLRIRNSDSTLRTCSDTCLCKQTDTDVVTFSHECRDKVSSK